MIYICVPAHNDAKTVGLVLWKIRQVFGSFPREYQLLVANDGSDDGTQEVLESYEHVLPMAVVGRTKPRGYARTVEELLRRALQLTDRPKRDCAVTLGGDFRVSPTVVPDLIRRIESGADLVVAEANGGPQGLGQRIVQRMSPWLLRPGVNVPGVRDLLSGVCAIRLVTLKRCLGDRNGALLEAEGISARAELVARTAVYARQITAIPVDSTDLREAPHRHRSVSLAWQLFRAGQTLHVPQPETAVQRAS